jgi:ATP-binding cassette, subfamily B, bacterial PglK
MENIKKIISLLNASQHKEVAILFIFMLISMILETFSIALIIPVLASIANPNFLIDYPMAADISAFFGSPTKIQLVIGSMVILAVAFLIKSIFLIYMGWRQSKFQAGLRLFISKKLFTGYMHLPYTFHLQRNSAELIRNVTGEVFEFLATVQSVMVIAAEVLVLIGISTLLLIVEPYGFFAVSGLVAITGSMLFLFTRKKVTKLGGERQEHDGKLLQHLQQGLGGVKDAKLLGCEEEFIKQYRYHISKSAYISVRYGVYQMVPRHLFDFVAIVGMTLLVLIMAEQGKPIDTFITSLGIFAVAAFRLMPSANRILHSMQRLRYNLPVVGKIHHEISMFSTPFKKSNFKKVLTFENKIQIRNVTYIYSGSKKNALSGINITIPKGSSVGFIGESGSGKSTLIDIVLGLLEPTKGDVLIDKVNIQDDLRKWQDQIGYVPQNIYFTDDTIRKNIAFGTPEGKIDDVAIDKAIQKAGLAIFIDNLPDGVNTEIGERGVRMSGGQKQRLGIARALYHNPEVIVFDEATSALDINTEKNVMNSINKLKGKKTLIIVAHRLSTVSECDKIYHFNQSKLKLEGGFHNVIKSI